MATEPRSYRELQVWRRSIEWVEAVYRASATWPTEERFGLTSQVRRAAVSIAANIAEGAERRTTGEFLQFIGIASGSLAETETLLILSVRLGYTEQDRVSALLNEAAEIGKMLYGLTAALRKRNRRTSLTTDH